jgi:hypothetical protein
MDDRRLDGQVIVRRRSFCGEETSESPSCGEIEEGEARSRKPPIQTHPTGTPSSP